LKLQRVDKLLRDSGRILTAHVQKQLDLLVNFLSKLCHRGGIPRLHIPVINSSAMVVYMQ